MCPGENELQKPNGLDLLKKVCESHRTPFDIQNADGENFKLVQETHEFGIHQEALETLKKNILNSLNQSYWTLISGDYGIGKTHLLQMLSLWAKENRIFFMWVNSYYGKQYLETYLATHILDAMVHTHGFCTPSSSPGNNISIFHEIAFPLFHRTIEDMTTRGDPEWTDKLYYEKSWLKKMFHGLDHEKEKEHLSKQLTSVQNFPALLQEKIDPAKLLDATFYFHERIPEGSSAQFKMLLELALAFEPGKQDEVFQRLLENAQKGFQNNLASALVFMISCGNVPICLVLDQFEVMYNNLKTRFSEGSADFKSALNEIFMAFEKFFNEAKNISLIFTCQTGQSDGLSKYLQAQIDRRISLPFFLQCPTTEQVLHIIVRRLQIFWKEMGYQPPDEYFPFKSVELHSTILNANKRLFEILKICQQNFRSELGKMAGIEDITSIKRPLDEPTTFDVGKKCLQMLETECRETLNKLHDIISNIEPLSKQEAEKEFLFGYIGKLIQRMEMESEYYKDIKKKIDLSDPEVIRKKKWYRLLRRRTIEVRVLKVFLEQNLSPSKIPTGMSIKNTPKNILIDWMISNLLDEKINSFVASCYTVYELEKVAKSLKVPYTGTKAKIISRIYEKPLPYEAGQNEAEVENGEEDEISQEEEGQEESAIDTENEQKLADVAMSDSSPVQTVPETTTASETPATKAEDSSSSMNVVVLTLKNDEIQKQQAPHPEGASETAS